MDPYLTMQGNLVADPTQTTVASGHKVTRFRIAANGRRFDSGSGDWVNTDTIYMSVSCWRQLGDNVMRSLHKGDTVVVHGRVRFREYDDANNGPRRQAYEIEAQSIGPDLSRYVAEFSRPLREIAADVPAQQSSDGARPAAGVEATRAGDDPWSDGGVAERTGSAA
jgi:single-strand DNA-binding protein